jgi:hypothetical protein
MHKGFKNGSIYFMIHRIIVVSGIVDEDSVGMLRTAGIRGDNNSKSEQSK